VQLTKRIHESRVTKVTNIPTASTTPVIIIPFLPRTSAMIFLPVSISPTLPLPPFIPLHHIAASSTLSLPYLPSSYHAVLLAPVRTLRLRLFQPIGELVIPRVLARITETRRFGRGPTYATTSSWWPSPSPPSHSSLSGPSRHVSIARSLPTTDYRESVEARVSRKDTVGVVDPSSRSCDHEGPAGAKRADEIVYEEAGSLVEISRFTSESRTITLVREGKSE